jgi:RNA polymerase sigma-70 factor (ECF subfamily)
MYQIARNVQIQYFNRNIRLASDFLEIENIDQNILNTTDEMEKQDLHQSLYEALNLLSVSDKEIIELSRFQDLKYEEIAEITGNSVGAIKVKVHRALKKLKDIYFQIA